MKVLAYILEIRVILQNMTFNSRSVLFYKYSMFSIILHEVKTEKKLLIIQMFY